MHRNDFGIKICHDGTHWVCRFHRKKTHPAIMQKLGAKTRFKGVTLRQAVAEVESAVESLRPDRVRAREAKLNPTLALLEGGPEAVRSTA